MRFLIPPGSRVLDIGCGIGDTLAALRAFVGLGLDFSPAMIDVARDRHPDLEFQVGDAEDPATIAAIGETFDFILVHDTDRITRRLSGSSSSSFIRFAREARGSSSVTFPIFGSQS